MSVIAGGRQGRVCTHSGWNESAYSMLTPRIEALSDPEFVILQDNKYIN